MGKKANYAVTFHFFDPVQNRIGPVQNHFGHIEGPEWLSSVRFKYKPGYRSCDLLKIRVLSLVENLFFQKNPLHDLLSSLTECCNFNQ